MGEGGTTYISKCLSDSEFTTNKEILDLPDYKAGLEGERRLTGKREGEENATDSLSF